MAARRPVSSAPFMALRWSGRFMVTVAMPSATPVRISSDMAAMVSSRPMTMFPGFTLPDELRMLREQIRRFIQEEIIPLEQRIDPDAPEIPDEDFERLAGQDQGRRPVGARRARGVRRRRARHLQHVRGAGGDVAAPHGPLQPGLRRLRPLSAAGDLGRHARRRSRSTRCPRMREGWRTFFAITEPSGGSDPAGAIQMPRRAARRQVGAQRPQGLHLAARTTRQWGVVFARTDKEKGRGGHLLLHPGARHAGLHRQAHPDDPHRGRSPTTSCFEDCEMPGRER